MTAMKIQIRERKVPDTSGLPDSLSPLLKRIYASRGLVNAKQLEKSARFLHSYQLLAGVDEAVSLLQHAIKQQQRIVVVGDFDVDGATSCALCVLALRSLGSQNVTYLVPNRFEEGYGLSPEVVDQVVALGVEVLMTVDNGVSSLQGVAYAKQLGIKVIVTDHHLPSEQLPNADAIVNPNLAHCGFPSKSLAGVGVAFYLMLALCVRLREQAWFNEQRPEPKLMELLDLVALGTVADVVALDANNRILVHQGLQRIRAGKVRPGIQALIEIAKKDASRLVAADFGFALAPRINAAGRLDDMSLGVELLLCEQLSSARQMAVELDALNQTRRQIEEGMKQEAMALCARLQWDEARLPYALVLYQADWHQGVIGLLAARIKEQFHRPVIAFAQSQDGLLKGSCRSIAALHMRDSLEQLSTQHPDLIVSFGGHAMAAGLTIKAVDYDRFRHLFEALVSDKLSESALQGLILTDGELSPEQISLETAELLRQAGPWGQAFPEPIFTGDFVILHQKLVGEKHLKLMLEPLAQGKNTGRCVDAIAFNVDLNLWPNPNIRQVRLAYKLDVNVFRAQSSVQLLVEHIVEQN